MILVPRTNLDVGHEEFPNAPVASSPHRVPACIPIVEVADDAQPTAMRRPNREMHAPRALDLAPVRAHHVERLHVVPLGDRKQIKIAYQGRESIGIADLP